MPKLKTAAVLDIPENIIANLEWHMRRQGVSIDDIAVAMGMSRWTYFQRKKYPGEITLKEVALAARKLKVSTQSLLYGALPDKVANL